MKFTLFIMKSTMLIMKFTLFIVKSTMLIVKSTMSIVKFTIVLVKSTFGTVYALARSYCGGQRTSTPSSFAAWSGQ